MSHFNPMVRHDFTKEQIATAIAKIKAEVNYDLIRENKYDKFGNGEYITTETVTRILNEAFQYNWSWEIISYIDKEDFVVCHGKLTVPGFGVRDGIGSAKNDKKDNSTSYSSAASFAFKNAAKRFGIAPNIFDLEDYKTPVFEPGTVKIPAVKKEEPSMEAPNEAPSHQPYEPKTKKQEPTTIKEKLAELKEAYNLETKSQFVAFAQIWNSDIQAFEDLKTEDYEALHSYVENHPQEFQDFDARNH